MKILESIDQLNAEEKRYFLPNSNKIWEYKENYFSSIDNEQHFLPKSEHNSIVDFFDKNKEFYFIGNKFFGQKFNAESLTRSKILKVYRYRENGTLFFIRSHSIKDKPTTILSKFETQELGLPDSEQYVISDLSELYAVAIPSEKDSNMEKSFKIENGSIIDLFFTDGFVQLCPSATTATKQVVALEKNSADGWIVALPNDGQPDKWQGLTRENFGANLNEVLRKEENRKFDNDNYNFFYIRETSTFIKEVLPKSPQNKLQDYFGREIKIYLNKDKGPSVSGKQTNQSVIGKVVLTANNIYYSLVPNGTYEYGVPLSNGSSFLGELQNEFVEKANQIDPDWRSKYTLSRLTLDDPCFELLPATLDVSLIQQNTTESVSNVLTEKQISSVEEKKNNKTSFPKNVGIKVAAKKIVDASAKIAETATVKGNEFFSKKKMDVSSKQSVEDFFASDFGKALCGLPAGAIVPKFLPLQKETKDSLRNEIISESCATIANQAINPFLDLIKDIMVQNKIRMDEFNDSNSNSRIEDLNIDSNDSEEIIQARNAL